MTFVTVQNPDSFRQQYTFTLLSFAGKPHGKMELIYDNNIITFAEAQHFSIIFLLSYSRTGTKHDSC